MAITTVLECNARVHGAPLVDVTICFKLRQNHPPPAGKPDSRRAVRHKPRVAYQCKREPLTQEEANRLAYACETAEEKLVIWALLDTGLGVAELASLDRDKID